MYLFIIVKNLLTLRDSQNPLMSTEQWKKKGWHFLQEVKTSASCAFTKAAFRALAANSFKQKGNESIIQQKKANAYIIQ